MGKNKSKDADLAADLAIEPMLERPELNDELTAVEEELHHARSVLDEARTATQAAAAAYQDRQTAEAACLHAYDQAAERARQHYEAERLRVEEHLRSVQNELVELDSKLTSFGEASAAVGEVATVGEAATASQPVAEIETEAVTTAEIASELAAVAAAVTPLDGEGTPTIDPPEAAVDDGVAYEDEWYQRMKRQSELGSPEGS